MAAGDPDDDRPWERLGAVRRDREPHRGGLLQSLALAGLFGSAVAFGLVFVALSWSGVVQLVLLAAAGVLVSVKPPLAIVTRIMAGRDIEKMGAVGAAWAFAHVGARA